MDESGQLLRLIVVQHVASVGNLRLLHPRDG